MKTKSAPRKVAKSESATSSKGIPLKVLAAKAGVEPKIARRKLRAAKLPFHSMRERWVFSPTQAAKAREILGA